MRFTKKIVLLSMLLLLISGCTVGNKPSTSDNNVNTDNKVSLNVKQADLIASFTDNLKYLNKDLLFELEDLEDSDKVNIIISLKSGGIVDSYNKNSKGYDSLSDYANSNVVEGDISLMHKEQQKLIDKLMEEKLINEVSHSYTTLFNGFSAETTYGQFKKIEKAGYDFEITLSEVYSEPESKTLSTDTLNNNSSSYDTVTNYVNVYETGIFNSSGVGYDGNNTSVAILDSGFDVHHTVFKSMPDQEMITLSDVEKVLLESKAYGYKQNIKAQDVYLNAKIPFVYDYADKDPDVAAYDSDHGTHVAGIIGGFDDVITGVAVNTQLVLMKVFGDTNTGAVQDDILAALEDAVLLGVDAINLSLGTSCGFSRSSDKEEVNVIYDKIEAAGISLVVAASNDYSSAYGGENGNTNKASNPDSATVGAPGTYTSALSVASISGVKSKYLIDETGYTFFFNESSDNAGEYYDFYEMIYKQVTPKNGRAEVEYVTVPGVGKKINYASIDVKGKIALVKRGDTSFEEKAQVALSQGAIGCIVYNNVSGDIFMNAGGNLKIALVSISKDDGEYLASKGSGKLVLDSNFLAGPFMSNFSSWGPVSDLSLKPEITAHGGTIKSSVPGGGYDEMSGTSMASPNLCGVVILIRQALKERYPNITPVELTRLTNQLLMSTATIVLDERGVAYSPRKQGAGLCNLEAALETLVYLSVEGSDKTKLELKDDPEKTGVYKLEFQVNNTSNNVLKYELSSIALTESLSVSDSEYVSEQGYVLNPKETVEVTGDGSISNHELTVNANGTVTVIYTLKLTEEDKAYIQESFVNGMFIEGFAKLKSLNEDKIDLNIPFLAFYGDWTQAPMFDKTFYEVESEAHNGAIDEEDKLKADYYASTPLGTYYYSYVIPMGQYVYEMDETKYDPIPASTELAAIGYNLETINGIKTVYAGLLRNAVKMTTVITNAETGEVVYEHVKYDQHKAYFNGAPMPSYDMIDVSAFELGLQNNTKYNFSMQAELDYGDGGLANNLNNKFEFSFYVDYEAPVIKDAEFYTKYNKSEKEYKYYVDVYVYDNHYAQSIRPFTIINGELVSLTDYVIPIYNKGTKGEINKVTVEITEYMDLLQYGVVEGESGDFKMSNGLGFLVDDYALNQSYSFVTLPGTNSNEIKFKDEYVASPSNIGVYQYAKKISIGDTLDLTKMITTGDPTIDSNEEIQSEYFAKLDWQSNNENVVKVKHGQLEAVGAGSATITCTSMNTDGYAYTISLKIDVRDRTVETEDLKLKDIKFTYFDTIKAFADGPEISEIGKSGDRVFFTDKHYISCYPSEQVKIGFELDPWNLKNYELEWASTNEKVASVTEDGVITAHKEGNATITLKVRVNGKLSTLMASTRVVVKNEFIIEGTTLTAYKGNGGEVVIPDDKGILYIGPFAFSLYTTDYEIEIEDDNYDMAKLPETNSSVTSVIIPGSVKEVQKYAFYNCTELENVTFLTEEDGDTCKVIREGAFYEDKKLKTINLDNIQIIGNRAFYDCDSLVNINTSKMISAAEQAFANCDSLEYVDITALRNIGKEIFIDCKNLKTIDSGEFTNFSEGMFRNSGLTTITYKSDRIPDRCFESCKSLKEVIIENDLIYVGKKAFNNCSALETVTFNNGVGAEFIYENAFSNCRALTTVTLPDSSFDIEKGAFKNCVLLETVKFNKNTYITENLGLIFSGCEKLSSFVVDEANEYYEADNNLLLSNDQKTIILAAPYYNYGEYRLTKNTAEGAFGGCVQLTSLIIASNVEVINKYSFEACTNLMQITIEGNTLINEGVFKDCVSLVTINNIENIKEIAPYTFQNTGLILLELNDVIIGEGAFSDCSKLINVTLSSKNILGNKAFYNTPKLKSASIDVKEIGDYAFYGAINLENLTLSNVEKIGEGAFALCNKLTSLNNSTVKYIGNYAFYDCNGLESITLDSIISIGEYAFSNTDELQTGSKEVSHKVTELNFGDTLEVIGAYAFSLNLNLEKVTIGSGIKEIGAYAFARNPKLQSISVEASLEVINEGVFDQNILLEEVSISGIKYIHSYAFSDNKALKTIDLTNVLEVGNEAFYGCSSLTELNMPNVKKLGYASFLLAEGVETVNIPVVEVIEDQALSCIGVSEIKLPNTIKFIRPTAFYYNYKQTKFTNMDGLETCKINDYIFLDEGVLYTVTANGKYELNAYPANKANDTYEVVFGTIRIAEYSGAGNNNLIKVILPDTLELIGNNAFYSCEKLDTVEFKSTSAPVLEGTVTMEIQYDENSEAYKFLTKYFPLNGYIPLYYAQFKDLVGTFTKLNIVVSKNANLDSYNHILYQLYFDVENIKKSDYVALNDKSIDYLNKVTNLPTKVSISDETKIKDAKTAYNLLDQDLTKYGYEQSYLDQLYNNLVQAEEAWLELKMTRVNSIYAHLIDEINKLGNNYDFNKLADYYNILTMLERVDRSDEKYIDQTNVENFKKGFEDYFKKLTEDINTVKEITTLPTFKVNKVGLVVVASVSTIISVIVIVGIIVIKKH